VAGKFTINGSLVRWENHQTQGWGLQPATFHDRRFLGQPRVGFVSKIRGKHGKIDPILSLITHDTYCITTSVLEIYHDIHIYFIFRHTQFDFFENKTFPM